MKREIRSAAEMWRFFYAAEGSEKWRRGEDFVNWRMRWIIILTIVLGDFFVGHCQVTQLWIADTSQVIIKEWADEDTVFILKKSDSKGEWIVYYDKTFTRKAYHIIYGSYKFNDTMWNRNGQLSYIHTAQEECHPCSNKWSWYSSGEVKSTVSCNRDSCVHLRYYKSGALKEKNVDIADSLFHGTLVWHYTMKWYENGQAAIDPYDPNSDSLQSENTYYPSGKIKQQAQSAAHHIVGPYKFYYESGQLQVSGQHKVLTSESGLTRGVLTGKWSYYNESGKLIKEEFYEEGKLANTITYD